MSTTPGITWVVLTTANRPAELGAALASIADVGGTTVGAAKVVIVNNGGPTSGRPDPTDGRHVLDLAENVGIPSGRDLGLRASDTTLVGFLDDDARLLGAAGKVADELFGAEPDLGAITFRLVDENGVTSRRHVPRVGHGSADEPGEVATFLGGASVLRREAYDQVGGYFGGLFYGHEELELSWRLVDHGWRIRYVTDVEVFHPRTDIARHAEGWRRTGRNRVWIARRTLPWLVAIAHAGSWLVIGAFRSMRAGQGRAYVAGWSDGWRQPVERDPIRWRAVWRLTRLGRPPVI